MSYKLENLVFENFNSYLGRHEISFVEKQGNLVLIRGIDELDKSSNGSGKSTIVDAIVFSFFGRSIKKELNLDDLICKKSNDPLRVIMTFVDSTKGTIKNRYKIERIRSKSPAYTQCNFFINDELVSANDTLTETQNKIENLIGIDYQMFIHNNILNPELFKFVKGNSSHKIDILERVLNLNIVSKIFTTLSNIAKEDQEVYEKINTEYYALKTTLKNLKDQEETVNKNINENISILTSKVQQIENEISEIERKRDDDLDKISQLNEIVTQKQLNISKLIETKSKLEHQINIHQKNIKYYETNKKCHACKQELPNREEILKSEKEKLSEEKEKLNKLLLELDVEKNSKEFAEYDDIVNLSNEYTKKIKELQYQISQNKKTISNLKSIFNDLSKVEEIENKTKLVEIDWQEAKEKSEITEFWKELLTPKSKTRMTLASDLLKILNSNIQKYVNNFYNKDFSFSFTIIDSNITESIYVNGEKFKYDQLSSGEKQKVDIVIVLSLLDIAMTYFKNNKLKFLIIDEALDHLDMISGRYVIEFIKQYAINLNMMCLLISHHSVIEEVDTLFDNTITAIKGLDGNSYVSKNTF
jgi:DNA repair exonuclease SbcCD ATPase subunit